jgi:hypothetical protein
MGAASKPEALAPRSRVTEIVMEIENDAEHFLSLLRGTETGPPDDHHGERKRKH